MKLGEALGIIQLDIEKRSFNQEIVNWYKKEMEYGIKLIDSSKTLTSIK